MFAPNWLRRGYLANVVSYCGTSVVSQSALVVQGFLVRRFLAPHLFGVWNLVTVFQSFLATFDPGITGAAFRELAVLNGTGKVEEAAVVRSTALWSRIGYSVLLASALLYQGHDKHGAYAFGMVAGAIIVVLSAASESFVTFYQSAQEYVRLSRATLTYSLAAAALLSAAAWLGGIYGLMTAAIAAGVTQLALLIWLRPRNVLLVRWTWNWGALKRLVAFGLPFRLVDYPQSVMALLDVLWIGKVLGPGPLAIYVTARSMLQLAIEIPTRIGNVFISRICNVGAVPERRPALAKELSAFLLVQYLVVLPIVIIGIGEMMSLLVRHFLKSYAASVPVMRWLLLAVYFTPQTTIVRNFWILDKRLLSLGLSNLFGLATMALSILTCSAAQGRSLPSVACGAVIGFGLYYVFVMFTVGREVWGWRHAGYLVAHASAVVLILGLITTGSAEGVAAGSWLRVLGELVFSVGRNLGLVSPLLIYGAWKLRLFLKTRSWQPAQA